MSFIKFSTNYFNPSSLLNNLILNKTITLKKLQILVRIGSMVHGKENVKCNFISYCVKVYKYLFILCEYSAPKNPKAPIHNFYQLLFIFFITYKIWNTFIIPLILKYV